MLAWLCIIQSSGILHPQTLHPSLLVEWVDDDGGQPDMLAQLSCGYGERFLPKLEALPTPMV